MDNKKCGNSFYEGRTFSMWVDGDVLSIQSLNRLGKNKQMILDEWQELMKKKALLNFNVDNWDGILGNPIKWRFPNT